MIATGCCGLLLYYSLKLILDAPPACPVASIAATKTTPIKMRFTARSPRKNGC